MDMHKVQNKKAIRRLSLRMVRQGKRKCLPGITAILLTTVLFTALFTVGGSLLEIYQDVAMRKMGSSAMAGIKFVREEDYKKLARDPAVLNARYRIILGRAGEEKLQKFNTEVSYATEEEAGSMYCAPTEGRMPAERMEIATSKLVLQALDVPCRIGVAVPLAIEVDGRKVRETFTLSGYWEGELWASAQQCWVSRAYCEKMAPAPESSFYEKEYEKEEVTYAGYWMVDFDFENSWNLEGKLRALLERNGYDSSQIAASVNSAYGMASLDFATVFMVFGLLCLIMLSGYLIIYNIFVLNVAGDIQSYGLLKTIGTTGRQLKKLVRCQALLLSAVGIPVGLLLGALLGKYILPAVASSLSDVIGATGMEVSLHPAIFLGASCFSFLTVWISCQKACRMAAKVSPIEASRYLDISAKRETAGRSRRFSKRRKGTAASLARANLQRSPRKVAVVVFSLSLSLVLLNSVYALVRGFDMEQYISSSLVGDALVSDASILQHSFQPDTAGVAEEAQEEIRQLEGVAESHPIYSADSYLIFGGASQERMLRTVREKIMYFEESPEDGILNYLQQEGQLLCQLYGMDAWGVSRLLPEKGAIDWEKFQTGDYIILNTIGLGRGGAESLMGIYYDVGDTCPVRLPDGSVKDYQVMAIADIPFAITSRFSYYLGTMAVLPEQEYLAHAAKPGALYQALLAGEGQEDVLEQSLEAYAESSPTLQYVSRKFYQKDFEGYIRMYWMVGGSLSFLLGLIGILNFTNSMVTGILTRKKEFAMMEAVGMTGRQRRAVLAWEGGIYAILVLACALAMSTAVNLTLLQSGSGAWFYESHFTVLPVVSCIPVLLALSCAIPLAVSGISMRQTVAERLREQ